MMWYLIGGVIAFFLVVALLIIQTRANLVSTLRGTVRIPRDLGALILIERFGRVDQMRQERKVVLPRNSDGRSKSHTWDTTYSVPQRDRFAVPEPVEFGAQLGYESIQNLLKIDEHVYTAMGTLTGEQLDSIGNLSQALSSWESVKLSEGLPQGAVNKLMGHLAEPVVAQNLEVLGVQVEMPDLSNQEGYDLVLNEEYFVNVKTVADASSLSSHFDKYPEIPVIVPEDMEWIPNGAISLDVKDSIEKLEKAIELGDEKIVLVAGHLSNAEMMEATETLGDAVLGNVDTVGIPVVTIAHSVRREFRLLKNRKTDMKTAAKNVGLDMFGTGVGRSSGAAIGAFFGSALFPGIGTVVGAAGGAIGVGTVARKITNKIKCIPLRKAQKSYERARMKALPEIKSLLEDARRHSVTAMQAETDKLSDASTKLKDKIKEEQADVIRQRRDLYRISSNRAQELLESALKEIENKKECLRTISTWKLWVVGKTNRNVRKERINDLEQLLQIIESEAMAIIKAEGGQDLVGRRAIDFLQLLLSADAETNEILQIVHGFEVQRKELETHWQHFLLKKRSELCDYRFRSMKALGESIGFRYKELKPKLDRICNYLELLAQSVRDKQTQLGL